MSLSLSKNARFILRFDDICPTMNWRVWNAVEEILIANDVKPILAVIPDNHDPHLVVDPPMSGFWARVRQWQTAGWTIAMHGYQHRYVTSEGGIMQLNNFSEFAGLSRHEQLEKLRAGLALFAREGVRADAWIAPAHSFDRATLAALGEVNLRVISDGFSRLPYTTKDGITWVPQQLWEFWPVGPGTWTVCCHLNPWSDAQLAQFRDDVARLRGQFSTFAEALQQYQQRRYGIGDRAFAIAWRMARSSRFKLVRGALRRLTR